MHKKYFCDFAKEAQKQKRLMIDNFFSLFCDTYYQQWFRIS